MSKNQKKFQIYLTVLRFISFNVTPNLQRINLDIDLDNNTVMLRAFYLKNPSDLDLELFDDICTDSDAHLPNFKVKNQTSLISSFHGDKSDFVVFSVYAYPS